MLKILKWIAPIFQPALSKILDENVMKETASDWGMLKDYIDKLPEIQAKRDHYPFIEIEGIYGGEISIAEGAELRAIRNMLDIVDKNHHWGGLERVVTPEGHILWLCKEHAREYK
ncbi:MAG: hypothetical protein JSV88_00390 [Candidatus Aminicenantes bacterium]|nr:MAG: hypothetical protein JSV88_00390 [Candidatus Aminicenantes bacterium]